MHSAIYQGKVRHRRHGPVAHRFRYRLFMMYLDLSELPEVFDASRLFSGTGKALARFCREDHMGTPESSLDQTVRDLVEQHSGTRPDGPIRLLTQLRYFGYVFNPVSFYYCFDKEDKRVETIVAEVNNTPWGEQHCYVLSRPADPPGVSASKNTILRFQPVKAMHVSPFMPMDVQYDWRFAQPHEQLTVHMENAREGRKLFDATLVLQREEISARSLARVLVAFPLVTVKIIAAIHWQALKLWLKRCPVYPHPQHLRQAAGTATRAEEKRA